MADTGAPWNIPYVENADLVKDYPTASLALANAIDGGLDTLLAGGIGANVVQTVKTDTFSTSSSSLVDITGLTASITPSTATSKILIAWSLSLSGSSTDGGFQFVVTDASDVILFQADAAGSRARSTQGSRVVVGADTEQTNHAGFYLWSPATTSAVTVKGRIAALNTGTVYLNRNANDPDFLRFVRATSSITVIEVAA